MPKNNTIKRNTVRRKYNGVTKYRPTGQLKRWTRWGWRRRWRKTSNWESTRRAEKQNCHTNQETKTMTTVTHECISWLRKWSWKEPKRKWSCHKREWLLPQYVVVFIKNKLYNNVLTNCLLFLFCLNKVWAVSCSVY